MYLVVCLTIFSRNKQKFCWNYLSTCCSCCCCCCWRVLVSPIQSQTPPCSIKFLRFILFPWIFQQKRFWVFFLDGERIFPFGDFQSFWSKNYDATAAARWAIECFLWAFFPCYEYSPIASVVDSVFRSLAGGGRLIVAAIDSDADNSGGVCVASSRDFSGSDALWFGYVLHRLHDDALGYWTGYVFLCRGCCFEPLHDRTLDFLLRYGSVCAQKGHSRYCGSFGWFSHESWFLFDAILLLLNESFWCLIHQFRILRSKFLFNWSVESVQSKLPTRFKFYFSVITLFLALITLFLMINHDYSLYWRTNRFGKEESVF